MGLVCLLTRAGEFIVQRGDPVAQLCVYRAEAGLHEIKRIERFPVETKDWDEKRARSDYKKDMDYFRDLHQTALQSRRTCHSGTRRRNDNGT